MRVYGHRTLTHTYTNVYMVQINFWMTGECVSRTALNSSIINYFTQTHTHTQHIVIGKERSAQQKDKKTKGKKAAD